MIANKTIEILQLQIDKLNQEQTENKWNEKDKKLFEKFLGLVHDDPFHIFYADGEEVHRILELVYPENKKEKIEELFRIKYIYDGFLKYGEVVKPQVEVERPNLEILIKDISDYYLEVYRKRKKAKENVLKQCRSILDRINQNNYIGNEEVNLIMDLAEYYEKTIDEKVQIVEEILGNNNIAMQELMNLKNSKKVNKGPVKSVEMKKEEVKAEELEPKVSVESIVEDVNPVVTPEMFIDVEEQASETIVEEDEKEEFEQDEIEEKEEDASLVELEDTDEVEEKEEVVELEERVEVEQPEIEEFEPIDSGDKQNESYIEQYVRALVGIDSTDVPAIHSVLPKYHMPNFTEIMNLLIETVENQIKTIKAEEEQNDGKVVRALREELGKAQQLLKILNAYVNKQEKVEALNQEKIVDGEEINLLLLENEDGDSLIESDFRKQLEKEQYGTAMELLRCLEQFSDPNVRKKSKTTKVSDIQELEKDGVHIFFEPFAQNTYIVIALLSEKNGYRSWVEDKLRLRHGLYLKQAKGMQRRWNQHGTRNTMLLGSETAYLEMQDMAEKR